MLVDRERSLNSQIAEKLAEVNRLRISHEIASEELQALQLELTGVREDITTAFLEEHLYPLGIDFAVIEDAGETFLSLSASDEIVLDEIRSNTGHDDLDRIPIFYIYSYLGKGLPFTP